MSDDSKSNEEPKIIVDDDWKSQVEKEKEQLSQNPDAADAADPADSPNAGGKIDEDHELPPASFLMLMSTLASQAMVALGFVPDPVSGEQMLSRPLAKHLIDSLAMLQEKTKGNLTEQESAHLRDALHQLRMAFVSSENASAASAPPAAEPKKSSTIELP